MKKKKIISFVALSLTACIMITGCGDDTPQNAIEYGDIEDAESSNTVVETNESEAGLPTYDPMSATQPLEYASDRKIEEKHSYYKEQLGTRPKRAFDSVYYAAENLMQSVEFESSQLITPSELENVMHILYLDCPEIFWLDTVFSYTVNSEGYVNSVNLYYIMDEAEIEDIQQNNAKTKPTIIKCVKSNDFTTINSILGEITNKARDYKSVEINSDGSYDFSCIVPFGTLYGNSIATSRLVTYWMRQAGIECTVAIGEPVSSTLTDSYELVTDYMSFKETQNSDGFYTIRYNYTCYWMWNLIKIDDKWYNLDLDYSKMIKDYFRAPYEKDTLLFVPDRLMSQTRLSYMNEEILGIMPSCTDVNFETLYRQGRHILPLTETQALKKLQEMIFQCDSQNIVEITWQCQDEQTYNYLIDNLEEQIDNYNGTYGNPIGSYQKLFVRDNLTITLYDIIYNF